MIELQTFVLIQLILYVVCTGVIALLWLQYRLLFSGLGFWVVGFIIYLVFSNRQRDIEAEIIHIDGMLEAEESGNVSE